MIKDIKKSLEILVVQLIEVPNSDLASHAFWQYSFNASLVALKHLFTFSFTVFHHGNECARKALICFIEVLIIIYIQFACMWLQVLLIIFFTFLLL
ncbi:hypothetical protein ACJX0J_034419, partial [Zea mays]